MIQTPATTIEQNPPGASGNGSALQRFKVALSLRKMALALFEGDEEGALNWLSTPKPALGGLSPIDVAQSDEGLKEVQRLISQLEHGVFT